jgi:hypothetical protein
MLVAKPPIHFDREILGEVDAGKYHALFEGTPGEADRLVPCVPKNLFLFLSFTCYAACQFAARRVRGAFLSSYRSVRASKSSCPATAGSVLGTSARAEVENVVCRLKNRKGGSLLGGGQLAVDVLYFLLDPSHAGDFDLAVLSYQE